MKKKNNLFKVKRKLVFFVVGTFVFVISISIFFGWKKSVSDNKRIVKLETELSQKTEEVKKLDKAVYENKKEKKEEKKIRDREISSLPYYCVSVERLEELKNEKTKVGFISEEAEFIENFLEQEKTKELLEKSENWNREICYSGREIFFVFYGDFGEFNNTIGIFTNGELIMDKKFIPNSGDIGMCQIIGGIEGSLIYSCGGGDGPSSWDTIYLLNEKTRKSTIIKKCTFCLGCLEEGKDNVECEVNILNLKQNRYE